MTKLDLIQRVNQQTGLNKKQSIQAVECFLANIKEELADGGKVVIRKFGEFSVKYKQSRMARNPKTGEEAVVSARWVPKFKAAIGLKKMLNREDGCSTQSKS